MDSGFDCPGLNVIALWSWLHISVRVQAREQNHNQHNGSEGIISGIRPQTSMGGIGEMSN